MSQPVPRIDQLQVGELDYRRSALATLSPSVADVERVAILQVEMKMGAVHVVGLGPKHRREHIAGAAMHAAEELRFGRG